MTFKTTTLGFAFAASMMTPIAAVAQNTDGDEEAVLDRIVVTSQKREQSVLEVPIAVSVIGGDFLEDRAVTDIRELTKLTPSVEFVTGASSRNSGFRIRGIGTPGFNEGITPTIGTVIDGVVLGRQSSGLVNLIDLERVEVLRGPQGTLFGASTTGGVFNIVTRQPSDEFELAADATYASYDDLRLRGTVSGPISEGNLSGRLTAYYQDKEGWIDNVTTGEDVNGREEIGARGKLLFTPDESWEVLLIADIMERDGTCCIATIRDFNNVLPDFIPFYGPITAGPGNRETSENFQTGEDQNEWGLSLQADKTLGNDVILTSITAHRSWEISDVIDADFSPLTLIHFEDDGFPSDGLDANQFTQEFRVTSPSGQDFEWLLGAFYMNQEIDRPTRFRGALLPFPLPIAPGVEITIPETYQEFDDRTIITENTAIFVHGSYDLNEQWEVFGGLRYSDIEITMEDFTRPGSTPLPLNLVLGPPLTIDEASTSDDALSGTAGIRFSPNENTSIYASYSRGFKGPALDVEVAGFDEAALLARGNGSIDAALAIPSETVDAYEIGLKTVLADGRVRLDTAIFQSDFTDFQASTFNPDLGVFVLQNAGELETRGFEVTASATLSDAFNVYGNLAYVDATFGSFTNGPCYNGQPVGTGPDECTPEGFQDLTGERLNSSPEWFFSGGGDYTVGLGDLDLSFILDASYRSDQVLTITQDPAAEQDAYWLVDAAISLDGLASDRVSVQVFGKNIFDEDYALAIGNTVSLLPTANNGHIQWLGEPQTFGIQLRFQY